MTSIDDGRFVLINRGARPRLLDTWIASVSRRLAIYRVSLGRINYDWVREYEAGTSSQHAADKIIRVLRYWRKKYPDKSYKTLPYGPRNKLPPETNEYRAALTAYKQKRDMERRAARDAQRAAYDQWLSQVHHSIFSFGRTPHLPVDAYGYNFPADYLAQLTPTQSAAKFIHHMAADPLP